MLSVAVVVFLLVAVLLTAKPLLSPGRAKLKLALLFCYVAFIAQCIDAYHSATYADERYVVGYAVDWFGAWWLLVLLATLGIIIALHITLIVAWRRRTRKKLAGASGTQP